MIAHYALVWGFAAAVVAFVTIADRSAHPAAISQPRSGEGDYVLDIEGVDPICVKTPSDCRTAIEAIRKGFLPSIPPGTPATCSPFPHCFPPESNCISGFNCKKR